MAIDTEERTTKKPAPSNGAPSAKNTNNKTLKIVLIIVGIVVVLGILSAIAVGFAIKKGAESFIGAATGTSISIDDDNGGEVTIKGKDGSSITSRTGSDAKLSEDFPQSDVPMYKNARIESTSDMTIAGVTSFTVSLTTKDQVESVIDFYEAQLSGGDWKKTYSSNSGSASMRNFTNESKEMSLTLSVVDDEDDTSITLSLRVGSYEGNN